MAQKQEEYGIKQQELTEQEVTKFKHLLLDAERGAADWLVEKVRETLAIGYINRRKE
jgi:hypothetical protein